MLAKSRNTSRLSPERGRDAAMANSAIVPFLHPQTNRQCAGKDIWGSKMSYFETKVHVAAGNILSLSDDVNEKSDG